MEQPESTNILPYLNTVSICCNIASICRKEPGSLVIVDSTGLKVYGKDEWYQEKHDIPARRTWRKLYLAIDENHHVLACELTTPEVGDLTAVPELLAQIITPFRNLHG
ncbi:MAG: transposase [Methylococcaceae bacterium]